MFIAGQLLLSLLLPGLASLPLLLAARRLFLRRPGMRDSAALESLAPALAFFVGYAAILGWPPLPALQAEGYLPWLAIASAIAGLALRGTGQRTVNTVLLLLCSLSALALSLGRIKPQYLQHGFMDWPQGLLNAAVLGLLLFVGWKPLERSAQTLSAPFLPAVFAVSALAAAVAQYLAHSAKLAQLELSLAAAALAMLLCALLQPRLRPGHSPLLVLWLLHGGLLICAHLYSGLGLLPALLLAALPPMAVLLPEQWIGPASQ